MKTAILLLLWMQGSVYAESLIRADVLLQDLKTLSADEMQGRSAGTPGGIKARDYLIRRFKESGIEPFGGSYVQEFTFFYKKAKSIHHGTNVLGFIRGKSKPHQYLVLSAHYDHLGMKKGKIYNGADDNASGAAALLSLASYFKNHPPHHTIIFCAFDAEETSGAGSRTFIEKPPVDKNAIVLNINMDMIGRDKNNILYAVGTYHYPSLKQYLEQVVPSAPVKLRYGHDRPDLKEVEDWTAESDHYIFHLNKIPFIYFGVEDFENHHQPFDDFETIQKDFYIAAVETIRRATEMLDQNLQ